MSWKTQTPMTERTKMLVEHLAGDLSVSELSERYGVSRRTVYKWLERYEADSWAGLEERSRAPQRAGRAVTPEVVAQLLALKAKWPLWGAPKLHHKLKALAGAHCPCETTVSNLLRRHGLTRAPRRRRSPHPAAPPPYGSAPNDVWCADFKGGFPLGNGQRCDPLTISDAATRYLLRADALSGPAHMTTARVQPLFIAAFREYGLPDAMRTDNGPPFASEGLHGLTALSLWWIKLGIRLERIVPGCPGQNGRHERMHRTLKAAAINPPAASAAGQQRQLDLARREYNEERPHESLGQAVPASIYRPSGREYPRRLPEVTYAGDWETRMVKRAGQMKWRGREVPISQALRGERVGLEPVADGLWRVWFGTLLLGGFDERQKRVHTIPPPAPPSGGAGGTAAALRSAAVPPAPPEGDHPPIPTTNPNSKLLPM